MEAETVRRDYEETIRRAALSRAEIERPECGCIERPKTSAHTRWIKSGALRDSVKLRASSVFRSECVRVNRRAAIPVGNSPRHPGIKVLLHYFKWEAKKLVKNYSKNLYLRMLHLGREQEREDNEANIVKILSDSLVRSPALSSIQKS